MSELRRQNGDEPALRPIAVPVPKRSVVSPFVQRGRPNEVSFVHIS